ncbi:hypothetical protein MTO96_028895 [Rhipicephalus appendiculatus]
MVRTLKEKIGALRKGLEVTSKSAPVAVETSAGPVGRKRKAVGDVAVSDKDSFESFRETMEKSLAEITSILQQLRVDVGQLKKQALITASDLEHWRLGPMRSKSPKEKGRMPHLPSSQSKAGADGN